MGHALKGTTEESGMLNLSISRGHEAKGKN